jgi:hypothetical protein
MSASLSAGMGFSFNRHDMADLLLRMSELVDPKPRPAAVQPAPMTVDEAARVLLANTGAFSTLVDVAETEHSKGVSFNCVVGRALRALAGEKP